MVERTDTTKKEVLEQISSF